jgi:hypothetical protein
LFFLYFHLLLLTSASFALLLLLVLLFWHVVLAMAHCGFRRFFTSATADYIPSIVTRF